MILIVQSQMFRKLAYGKLSCGILSDSLAALAFIKETKNSNIKLRQCKSLLIFKVRGYRELFCHIYVFVPCQIIITSTSGEFLFDPSIHPSKGYVGACHDGVPQRTVAASGSRVR